MKVYIYSSGSVEAQKLLFGHSTEGDILEVGYLVSEFVCYCCDKYYDYKPPRVDLFGLHSHMKFIWGS